MIPAVPPVFLEGFAAVLAVAAVGVSLFAVWHAARLVELADGRAQSGREQSRADLAALEKALGGLAAQVDEFRRLSPAGALPAAPRPGLNLTKRSEVLRMHRHGDPPDRIAAVLEVPLQEVDLLIKVQRIVIGKLSV